MLNGSSFSTQEPQIRLASLLDLHVGLVVGEHLVHSRHHLAHAAVTMRRIANLYKQSTVAVSVAQSSHRDFGRLPDGIQGIFYFAALPADSESAVLAVLSVNMQKREEKKTPHVLPLVSSHCFIRQ